MWKGTEGHVPIEKENMWKALCEWLSSQVGALISRPQLLTAFDCKNNPTLVDNYRNYLTKAGYLQIKGRGLYKVKKRIPEGTSIKTVYAEAYFGL